MIVLFSNPQDHRHAQTPRPPDVPLHRAAAALCWFYPGSVRMSAHHLAASVETCHWGLFDAKYPPVLRVASGDSLTVDTVSGGPDALPPAGFHVPP